MTTIALAAQKFTARSGRTVHVEVRADGRIYFVGGQYGEHSLDLASSSSARIAAHLDGYLANG